MKTKDQETGLLRQGDEDVDEETDYQPINWKKLFLSWKMLPLWIIVIIVIVLSVLLAVDNAAVVEKLTPISHQIKDIPAGWLIPIAILILISFPPLFGHEIVAILVGIVWGLWEGFGIVTAGTFFGEIGTWYAFMYVLRRKAKKLERTNLTYGALARLVRDGGFWIVLLVRFSVVPSHMSTAVFSTCGVKFWHFVVSTFLSLPKQLIVVYMGVLIAGQQSDKVAKVLVFLVGGGVTAVISWYIFRKLGIYKKILLEEQEQRKLRVAHELNRLQATETSDSSISDARLEPPEPIEQQAWSPSRQPQWNLQGQYQYSPQQHYQYTVDQQSQWDSVNGPSTYPARREPQQSGVANPYYQSVGQNQVYQGSQAGRPSALGPNSQAQSKWDSSQSPYDR